MSDKRDLIIVGGGGFAREVIWLARECGEWNLIGLLDERATEAELCDVPVLGGDEKCRGYLDAWYVVAIGSPRVRRRIVARLQDMGVTNFATLIHPSVAKSEFVTVGEGSMICAGCILTTQIEIGRHNILNLSVTVGHDTKTGDFVTVSPLAAISGAVTLEDGVEVGTNATIIQGLTMSTGTMLGAGSTLTKSLETPDMVAIGSPARALKSLDAFSA